MEVQILLQTIVFGLALGGVLAPAAVGLTLSFGVTGFVNFSYGGILTISAYTTALMVTMGLPLIAAAGVAVIVGGIVTWAIAWLLFDPLRGRGFALLVTSIGVAFMIQNLVAIVFGSSPRAFPIPLLAPWQVGGVIIPKLQTIIFVVGCVAMLSVHILLQRSLLGKTMRAVASNDDLTRLSGLDPRRIIGFTWFLSGLVAGLGGVLLGASLGSIDPTMGFQILLLIFAATMVGGIGKPYGAMAGALLMGLAVNFGATYVSAEYNYAIAFGALVIALLIRPQGLFGRPVPARKRAT